jgi:signal transduction histidine kinase/CheY-like chemotaxis protein
MITRHGEPVTFLLNAGRIKDGIDGGELIEGIAMDVSDRNRAEEDRHRLALQLQQSQKLESLGVLAGGIAHDFNNMLMAILSNISLAKRSAAVSEETLRRLNEAEEVCLRATSLTQQLLTFSKGGRPIRKIAAIGRLIEEATVTAARGGNCHYDCRSNPELWPVEVDDGQIAQVIQNLVANAIQAMPQGGTVSVTSDNLHLVEGDVPTLEAGRYVRIEVVDTGCGIPEDELESIFDPFFTTKKGSSGLGLATAFSIVRSHGGAIVVHSEPDQGSRFSVYLPASEETRTTADADTEDFMRGHGRLLIMDDDEAVRSAAAELLETIGYEVDTAADGSEAIALYTRALEEGHRYHAVVLDLTVPGGVGGRETMSRLLAIDPGVKAVVSSGYSTDPVMANFREYGFSGVAVKPYRLADLAHTLKLAIDTSTTR